MGAALSADRWRPVRRWETYGGLGGATGGGRPAPRGGYPPAVHPDGSDPLTQPGIDDATDDFEAMITAAIADLPPMFADRLGSVAIVVEEEPSPGQLAATGAAGLFGLYQGVPRTAWGADQAASPSKITIFRGPHERAFPDPVRRSMAVRDTVLHEIAHHFGIGDARLRELADQRRAVRRAPS